MRIITNVILIIIIIIMIVNSAELCKGVVICCRVKSVNQWQELLCNDVVLYRQTETSTVSTLCFQ
jgi:hypothetical protein